MPYYTFNPGVVPSTVPPITITPSAQAETRDSGSALCFSDRVARVAWSYLNRQDAQSRMAFTEYASFFPGLYFADEDFRDERPKARGPEGSVFGNPASNSLRIPADVDSAARLAVINRLWEQPPIQVLLRAGGTDFVALVRSAVPNVDTLLPELTGDREAMLLSLDPQIALLRADSVAYQTTAVGCQLLSLSVQPNVAPTVSDRRVNGKRVPNKVDPTKWPGGGPSRDRVVEQLAPARVVGAAALPNNQVLVTFSEPMDPATLTTETFLVPGFAVVGVEVAGIAATVELSAMEARLYSIQVLPTARTMRGTPLDPAQSTATFVGIEGIIRESGAPLPDNRTPWGKIAMAVGAAWLVTRLFK